MRSLTVTMNAEENHATVVPENCEVRVRVYVNRVLDAVHVVATAPDENPPAWTNLVELRLVYDSK